MHGARACVVGVLLGGWSAWTEVQMLLVLDALASLWAAASTQYEQ